jgi:hypothetical protein
LTATSSPARPILGYTDTETVKLDFDDTAFRTVRYWALRAMRWFKLRGFLILESSPDCYHVVFDRTVSWSENVAIMAWVALTSKHWKLTGWFILQCIKRGSTLRVSTKGDKRSPRIVRREESQNDCFLTLTKYGGPGGIRTLDLSVSAPLRISRTLQPS